jgi:hypothetical protein
MVAHSVGLASGSPPGFVESEGWLHEAAIRAVGFDDFGEEPYLDGLRALLDSYDRESKLGDDGRRALLLDIQETLEKRLRSERAWKRDPDLLAHAIRRPIFIVGLVRTGSTALHYLMGQDPGLQKLEYWLASHPQPRPPREQWERIPDFLASQAEIDVYYGADPSLRAMHFMDPALPEECRHFLAQSFTDDGFEVRASAPSYSRWYRDADMRGAYRRHQKLVKLVGATDPGRRWLLKYSVHVRNLPALLEVYPDACIVWTHRDPSRVMRSYASVVGGFRSVFEREVDLCAIAREQIELWASGLERAIAFRRGQDPRRFFDLHFGAFRADPVGSVKRIYAHFDQPLSSEGERRLTEWARSNPEQKHGRHEYVHKDIGIGDEEVRERFSAYLDFFGIERERSAPA